MTPVPFSPYILLVLGYLLIFLEFYLPGAVLGILGGILLFISLLLFIVEGGTFLGSALYLVLVLAGLIILVKFTMWRIRSAKPGSSIYSNDAQTGYVASSFDATAIGKKGIVDTDLKPGGHIIVDGRRHQAISLSGYITKGSEVHVVDGQEESLLVTAIKK